MLYPIELLPLLRDVRRDSNPQPSALQAITFSFGPDTIQFSDHGRDVRETLGGTPCHPGLECVCLSHRLPSLGQVSSGT
jgi:hypothetical protein